MDTGFGEDYYLYLTLKSLIGTEIRLTVNFKVHNSYKDKDEDQYKLFEPSDLFRMEGRTLQEK